MGLNTLGETGGSGIVVFPVFPGPLTSDVPPTTLAEFHGQNAWSQAVVNTTGGNVSVDAGIGTRRYTIVANIAAPGLAGSLFTTSANGTTTLTLTAVAGAPGAGQFQIGTDDTAPQLAVTATNFAAALNANAPLAVFMSAVAVANVVAINIKPACETLTIATNAAGADATATSGVDGFVKFNGLQTLAPDGLAGTPSYSFVGDHSLGFFRSGANQLSVSIGGAQQFTFYAGQFSIFGNTLTFGGSADVALVRNSPAILTVTDGATGGGRLWVGGDTVGGLGLMTALAAGWGTP